MNLRTAPIALLFAACLSLVVVACTGPLRGEGPLTTPVVPASVDREREAVSTALQAVLETNKAVLAQLATLPPRPDGSGVIPPAVQATFDRQTAALESLVRYFADPSTRPTTTATDTLLQLLYSAIAGLAGGGTAAVAASRKKTRGSGPGP